MKPYSFKRTRKTKRVKNKKSRRKPNDTNKYTKLSKVQCNDTGADCIWDDKVTAFD